MGKIEQLLGSFEQDFKWVDFMFRLSSPVCFMRLHGLVGYEDI